MKIQVLPSNLKKKCKVGDIQALKESLELLQHNAICRLAYGKEEDYRQNQGHLKALEEVLSLISTP